MLSVLGFPAQASDRIDRKQDGKKKIPTEVNRIYRGSRCDQSVPILCIGCIGVSFSEAITRRIGAWGWGAMLSGRTHLDKQDNQDGELAGNPFSSGLSP
jgi:hypothetical protein